MNWRKVAIRLGLGVGLSLVGMVTILLGRVVEDVSEGSLQRAPYNPLTIRKTVEFWEGRVRRTPDRFLERRELAGAYLARQRVTGDIQDAVRAEREARRSIELVSRGNVAALTRLARSLLAQHRFPDALKSARSAAQIDLAAWLLVADVELELGHDAEARKAYTKSAIDPNHTSALVLRARFAQADGDHYGVLRLLRQAARQADELSDLPAEAAAWFHVMVGHTLIDRGRLDEGTTGCRAALAIFPADYRAMTGLAEAAAFRGEWDEVEAWGGKAIQACPQNPEALALLAEAALQVGEQAKADGYIRQFKELAHSFPRIYDRHWALFCADNDRNLGEAYALARNDLELRQDAGAYETLAWTAFKMGHQAEAEAALRSAIDLKPQTAAFFRRAETISRAAGQITRADTFRDRARELNRYAVKGPLPARPGAGD